MSRDEVVAAIDGFDAGYDTAKSIVERALDEVRDWTGPFGYPGVAAWLDRRDAHILDALNRKKDRP